MEIAFPAHPSIQGHPQRLPAFRLLMRGYPDRVPAGERAKVPGLKASTLSACLGPSARGSGSLEAGRQNTVDFCRVDPAQHRIALQQKTDGIGRISIEVPS